MSVVWYSIPLPRLYDRLYVRPSEVVFEEAGGCLVLVAPPRGFSNHNYIINIGRIEGVRFYLKEQSLSGNIDNTIQSYQPQIEKAKDEEVSMINPTVFIGRHGNELMKILFFFTKEKLFVESYIK